MDLAKYYENLPSDLKIIGKTDEYKLLILYSFYAYYGGDEQRIDELLDSVFYSRQLTYNIDGVFINSNLEEDTLELVYSYSVGNQTFSLNKVNQVVNSIYGLLSDSLSRNSFSDCSSSIKKVGENLDELENKDIILRIITDYDPDENEAYSIRKNLNNIKYSLKKGNFCVVICFLSDILNEVDANTTPFEYVPEGKLIVDDKNNILRFDDNSFVCNISAKSLKELWRSDGNKGLLAMNLRYHVTGQGVDDKIEESIQNNPDDFWYLNNGIIIVCDNYNFVNNELRMKNFSIVNGGQTSKKIGEVPFDEDFYLTCKVVRNIYEDLEAKNTFIAKVAEASNTQKPIKAKDIIANKPEQRLLKSELHAENIFIEIKRGEKGYKKDYPEPWQRTKNNELAQDLYAFVFLKPGAARNNVSKILSSEAKYNSIFKNHDYDVEFLKSLLFLEKALRDYQKMVNKSENYDATNKGLVKNGLFYFLGVIGYLLKQFYNKEYRANLVKFRNNEAKRNIYANELAFNHKFIKKNVSYKEFKINAYNLFDQILNSLLKIEYENKKESSPTLVYSNWTKSEPGFEAVVAKLNRQTIDLNDTSWIDEMKDYFLVISEEQENKNIDQYMDLCHFAEKKEAKNTFVKRENFTEQDQALLNELLTFLTSYAIKKNISTSKVATDKQLEKVVRMRPENIKELTKYLKRETVYYIGEQILEIVNKYKF